MRRKKRYGVYSNHTIKRCNCFSGYCRQCKSVCKTMIPGEIDTKYNWHYMKEYTVSSGRPQVHKYGFGSLYPGRKFVMFEMGHYSTYRSMRNETYLWLQRRKRSKKDNTKSEMMEFMMQERIEKDIQRREKLFFDTQVLIS